MTSDLFMFIFNTLVRSFTAKSRRNESSLNDYMLVICLRWMLSGSSFIHVNKWYAAKYWLFSAIYATVFWFLINVWALVMSKSLSVLEKNQLKWSNGKTSAAFSYSKKKVISAMRNQTVKSVLRPILVASNARPSGQIVKQVFISQMSYKPISTE